MSIKYCMSQVPTAGGLANGQRSLIWGRIEHIFECSSKQEAEKYEIKFGIFINVNGISASLFSRNNYLILETNDDDTETIKELRSIIKV